MYTYTIPLSLLIISITIIMLSIYNDDDVIDL